MIETPLPCRVETNLFLDDTYILDIGHFMAHVSVVLSQFLHEDRLIDTFKVRF